MIKMPLGKGFLPSWKQDTCQLHLLTANFLYSIFWKWCIRLCRTTHSYPNSDFQSQSKWLWWDSKYWISK